jgi:hypothetical protein
VRPVARYRHQDLFEKGLDIGVHEISEGWHRAQGTGESGTRYFRCAPRNLDEQSDGGTLGAEDGLETRATLSADRCHFYDTAVFIDSDHRDDATIREKNIVERAIGVQQDLTVLAGNRFKLLRRGSNVIYQAL